MLGFFCGVGGRGVGGVYVCVIFLGRGFGVVGRRVVWGFFVFVLFVCCFFFLKWTVKCELQCNLPTPQDKPGSGAAQLFPEIIMQMLTLVMVRRVLHLMNIHAMTLKM